MVVIQTHGTSQRLRPILAVTFDLDDTLWAIWPTIARAERALDAWLRSNFPRIAEAFAPLDLRQLCQRMALANPRLAHDPSRLRSLALRHAAHQCGYVGFPVEEAFAVFYAERQNVELYADVLPALERLQERYALGALSNGNANIQLVGLGHLFAFAINAAEIGEPKPMPGMFLAACCRLGVSPSQIAHVGDHPEHDVLGAARAGLQTVWLNRDGAPWPGGRRPDAEIATLCELEHILCT